MHDESKREKSGSTEPLRRFLIHEGERAFFVPLESVLRMEAEGDFVRLHLAAQTYRVRATLSALQERLPADQFLQVNRSLIVNVDQIAELRARSHGDYDVLLRDGRVVRFSRLYRKGLQKVGGIYRAAP